MNRVKASVLGMTVVAAISLTGCQQPTNVTWTESGQPVHQNPNQLGWGGYLYVYHSGINAYYEPYSQRYFWFEDGSWRAGDTLPIELDTHPRHARFVRLHSPYPFENHDSVRAMVPSPGGIEISPRFQPQLGRDAPVRMVHATLAPWATDEAVVLQDESMDDPTNP